MLTELDKVNRQLRIAKNEYEYLRRKKNKEIELMKYERSRMVHCFCDYLEYKDQLDFKEFKEFEERWKKGEWQKDECLQSQ